MGLVKQVQLGARMDYRVYTSDTPAETFEEFAPIKELYDSKRQGDALPAWRDFAFEEFKGWHGWINVEDILSRSPYDARFRLWGTYWTDTFEVELTGKCYRELEGKYISSENLVFWEEMSKTHHIGMGGGALSWLDTANRYFGQNWKDMSLPLANDGQTVDKYLTLLSIRRK